MLIAGISSRINPLANDSVITEFNTPIVVDVLSNDDIIISNSIAPNGNNNSWGIINYSGGPGAITNGFTAAKNSGNFHYNVRPNPNKPFDVANNQLNGTFYAEITLDFIGGGIMLYTGSHNDIDDYAFRADNTLERDGPDILNLKTLLITQTNLIIYEEGDGASPSENIVESNSDGDVISIVYKDTSLTYYKNGNLIGTSPSILPPTFIEPIDFIQLVVGVGRYVNLPSQATLNLGQEPFQFYDGSMANGAILLSYDGNQTAQPNAQLTIVDAPTNGIAVVNSPGDTITYTPNLGFVGIDTFTYDSNLTGKPASVTVNVSAPTGGHPAWRLFIHNNYPSTAFITIKQLQLKDGNGTILNNGTVFASNTASGSSPNNAFDLSSSTVWDTSSGFNTDQYIGMMFTELANIFSYRVISFGGFGGDRAPYEWSLQYSDNTTDGTDGIWEDVDSHTNSHVEEIDWSVTPDNEFIIPNIKTDGIWNPNQTQGSLVAFSNNNLTITQPSAANIDHSCKTNISHNRGKWYLEILVLGGFSTDNKPAGLVSAHIDFILTFNPDHVVPNFTGTGRLLIAYDGDNKTVTFSKNGTPYNTTTGLSDISYYIGQLLTRSGKNATINFGGSPFSYDIPAGYLSWDTNQSFGLGWTTTLVPADVTLSNNNLIATSTTIGTHKSIFTNHTRTHLENVYFEIIPNSGIQQDTRIGISLHQSAAPNLNNALGNYPSVGWSGGGGGDDVIANSSVIQNNIASWTFGDVIGIVLTNGFLQYRLNNLNVGNPIELASLGITGVIRGAMSLGVNIMTATINIGNSPFVYTIPKDHDSWNGLQIGTASYDIATLDLGPIRYWPLQETSGTTTIDLIAGNNGTIQNNPTLGVLAPLYIGDTSTAYDFLTSTPEYISFPGSLSVDINGKSAVTLTAWVKINNNGGAVFGTRITGTSAGFECYVTNTAMRVSGRSRTSDGYQNSVVTTPIPLSDGNWHHVAFVLNYTTKKALHYLDGVILPGSNVTVSFGSNIYIQGSSPDSDRIGQTPSGLGPFNDQMQKIAIYDKELTNNEIDNLYTVGSTT